MPDFAGQQVGLFRIFAPQNRFIDDVHSNTCQSRTPGTIHSVGPPTTRGKMTRLSMLTLYTRRCPPRTTPLFSAFLVSTLMHLMALGRSKSRWGPTCYRGHYRTECVFQPPGEPGHIAMYHHRKREPVGALTRTLESRSRFPSLLELFLVRKTL
ncbi:hypothetical protein JB92DRAFT_2882196 [Gautieria morchelliformis]|nr:hypothetical protein JB92DRAFT_2882196 [Gautieria morchelliformis]